MHADRPIRSFVATVVLVAGAVGGAACSSDGSDGTGPSGGGSVSTTSVVGTEVHQPYDPDASFDVEVEEGVVYGRGETASGPVDLRANVYTPLGVDGTMPVVLVVPGGGFRTATLDSEVPNDIADVAASHGAVGIVIEYRQIPDEPVLGDEVEGWAVEIGAEDGSTGEAVVAAAEDLLQALRWVGDQAEPRNLDPERVAFVGGSAGAITAINVADTADDAGIERPPVAAVVSFWGGMMLGTPADAVQAGDPPLLLFHGTADERVPYAWSEAMRDAAEAAGVAVELVTLEGAGHGFADKDLDADVPGAGRSMRSITDTFLAEQLA